MVLFSANGFAQDAIADAQAAFADGSSCAKSLDGCYKTGRGDVEKLSKACADVRQCKKDCRAKRKSDKKSCKGLKGKEKRECKKGAKKNCVKSCKSKVTDSCKASRKGVLKGLKNCAKKANTKECKNTAKRVKDALSELLSKF